GHIPTRGERETQFPPPANTFRQGKRRRCDQRAMVTANQELQHQGRAVDHLSPPPLVLRFRNPPLPELGCVAEALLQKLHFRLLASSPNPAKQERRSLTGP